MSATMHHQVGALVRHLPRLPDLPAEFVFRRNAVLGVITRHRPSLKDALAILEREHPGFPREELYEHVAYLEARGMVAIDVRWRRTWRAC